MLTLEQVKSRIFTTLVSYPKIITVLDLDIGYFQTYGNRIPFQNYGYKSLEKLLVKISEISITGKGCMAIVTVTRARRGNDSNLTDSTDSLCDSISWSQMKQKFQIWNGLLANENNKQISTPSEIPDETGNCRIPVAMQSNLKILIRYFDNGLRYNKLPIVYRTYFNEDLDFRRYNYDSLLEMCTDLQDVFLCFSINDEMKLYHREDPVAKYVITYAKLTNNSSPLQTSIILLSEIAYENIFNETSYALNAMQLHETIPRQFIPEDKKMGDAIDVCVTEVFDLSKFWITLQSEIANFQEMHDKMQLWYKKYSLYYKIPEHMIKCGLYCVVMYDDQYYRGIIVKILATQPYIKVFFVDYGTLSSIYKTRLLFLNKTFSELPRQAIRARLGRIQPQFKNSIWSEESFEEFLNLVYNKYLLATIVKKSKEVHEVVVILEDKENRICVNQLLVKQRHAIYDVQKQQQFTLGAVPSVNCIYLYPTFNEIEQGIVPTAEETYKLLQSGLEYEYILPHYFRKMVTANNLPINIPSNEESCSRTNHSSRLPIQIPSLPAVYVPSVNVVHDSNCVKSNFKQQLEFLIFINIRNKNIAPLYYLQYLLREISIMDNLWQSIFNKLKEEIMSISSTYLQNFVSVVLNFLTTEKLLELYSFTHHTMSNMKFINKIGINEVTNGKLIGKTVFNGRAIYLYRINNQFYVDIRDIIEIMNLGEISLDAIQNQLDLIDVVRSVLAISVVQSPLLIQELEKHKISYVDYIIFLEVQFIPRFCEIFAGGFLPKLVFEKFFERVAIDGWCW